MKVDQGKSMNISFVCRFVNTVIDSSMTRKRIWSHIHEIRFEYLREHVDLSCIQEEFISEPKIKINTEKLSHMVGVKSSDKIDKNLSRSDLQVGAEMFLAVNACPSFYEKLYWKTFYGSKSRIVMLASNIVKKAKIDFRPNVMKIFSKISSVLGFQHIILKHEGKNSLDNNIVLSKNIVDIKGLKLWNMFRKVIN